MSARVSHQIEPTGSVIAQLGIDASYSVPERTEEI